MYKSGKNINLYLIDGNVNGRMKCSLANWTGVAYKIPRIQINKSKNRDDLNQTGVYFLFGISDITEKPVVYVGQAGARKNGEGLISRLIEHTRNSEKDYWTEAVVLTTSNNSFGPTEISYLENRFVSMASEASRYEIKNANDPTPGNITEEKESELVEFIHNAKIVMGVLGHKVFEKLDENTETLIDDSESVSDNMTFYFERKSSKSEITVRAICKQTSEGFVVLKGSLIETINSLSIPPGVEKSRRNAKIDSQGILLEDILFKSPTYAAGFVIGGHVNGSKAWKTKSGVSFGDLQ